VGLSPFGSVFSNWHVEGIKVGTGGNDAIDLVGTGTRESLEVVQVVMTPSSLPGTKQNEALLAE